MLAETIASAGQFLTKSIALTAVGKEPMMKPWLLMLALAPTSYANAYADVSLQGKIAGFVHKDSPLAKGGNDCYVAISDAAASLNNIYLRIDGSGMCWVAEAAYYLGEPVKVMADSPSYLTGANPAAHSLELKRDDRPKAFRDSRLRYLEDRYDMKGRLSGFKAGKKGSCEIAITTKYSRYADTYHRVEDNLMCKLALAAYASLGEVSATAGKGRFDVAEITKLEVTRGGLPYWPPYHVDRKLSHYALHGPVGGYAMFKNNPFCFVSIKNDEPYGNGYHKVMDRPTCAVLLGAYFSGSSITVGAVSLGDDGGGNQIMRVDLANDDKAHWPPYERANSTAGRVSP